INDDYYSYEATFVDPEALHGAVDDRGADDPRPGSERRDPRVRVHRGQRRSPPLHRGGRRSAARRARYALIHRRRLIVMKTRSAPLVFLASLAAACGWPAAA